jgi:peptidyl-prolyl cis-trans isomerase C
MLASIARRIATPLSRLHRAARPAALLAGAALIALPHAAIAQSENPSEIVVATVNGEEIYLSELQAQYASLPDQYRQVPMAMMFDQLISLSVDNRLLTNEAESAGIEDDEDVQKVLAAARAQVLREAFLNKMITDRVTEEALQARYEEKKADPTFSYEEVRARHILVEDEETANDVIGELDGGADFGELAQERSTGPSGPNGGDLGYFQKGQMVPPFAEAAFTIEPGSYGSEPVETQFGWHVILVEDKRMTTPSFEETEQSLREELTREIVTAELDALREEATVERFDMEGNPIEAEDGTSTE